MNEAFRDVFTDKRKFFVVLMIVVPFLAYSGYYYYNIFKNAPFRGDQFEYVELKKFRNGSLRETINTKTGEYTYYNSKDSLIHQKINLSASTLHELHLKMMDILFWNIEHVSGDSTMQARKQVPLYYVKAVYDRKTQSVWWQQRYFDDQKLDDRMGELVRTIEEMATMEMIKKTK